MSITENIETVVATFQKGRALSEQELGLDELITELNKFEPRYRSVAFEGASVGIALSSTIEMWLWFKRKTEKHATQVHIGLGWSIAEGNRHIRFHLLSADDNYRTKALDGIGYWYGLFQRRATIRTQQIPEDITSEYLPGFDQGVGRAIWYATKGEADKVVNIINHFTEDRRPNLWQGIGVASTYVGGCSNELIAELKSAAGESKTNLEKGIEAAEESMLKAQT